MPKVQQKKKKTKAKKARKQSFKHPEAINSGHAPAPESKTINMTKDRAGDLAAQYYEDKNLRQAESICRQVLKAFPDHCRCLNLLAAIARDVGKYKEGLNFIDRSLSLNDALAESHIIKGLLLKHLGKLNLAAESYSRAIVLEPGSAQAHSNLSSVLQELDCLQEAESISRKAIELDPTSAGSCFNLGNALIKQDKIEDAVASFRQALSLDNTLLKAHQQIANAYNQLGELDKARDHLELALEIDPFNVTTHYTLSPEKKYKPGDKAFQDLEKVLKSNGLSLDDQIKAHFSLGKMYADISDYDSSFAHYTQGNKLRTQAGTAFDPKKFTTYISLLTQLFTETFFERFQGCGHSTQLPVFIVGMPRSGTTLVEQILSSHPLVFGAGELTQLADCLEEIITPRLNERLEKIIQELNPEQLSKAAASYLGNLPETPAHIQRIADKMPHNFMRLWLVALLFPNASIIHCTRNPLDTCLSCFTTHFTGGHDYSNDLQWLGTCYIHYQRLMQHWKKVLPMPIFEVQYEELVGDIETKARQIVAHCNLEWDEQCMAFHTQQRVVKTASLAQVRQPLYTSSINRWKKYEDYLQPLHEQLFLIQTRKPKRSI